MERKVKYDYAFKLECVELVLKKHYSDGYVSKLKQIPRWNIRKWISFYNTYGEIGLLPRINQSYSGEFKLKVLRIVEKESLSLMETGIRFNIPNISIISKWKKDFANFGIEALQPKSKGRPISMSDYKRKRNKIRQTFNKRAITLKRERKTSL